MVSLLCAAVVFISTSISILMPLGNIYQEHPSWPSGFNEEWILIKNAVIKRFLFDSGLLMKSGSYSQWFQNLLYWIVLDHNVAFVQFGGRPSRAGFDIH